MPDILLSTINARHSHTSFGLRCLRANLKELHSRSEIREYTLTHTIEEMARDILAAHPVILGLGVYIWNAETMLRLIPLLRKAAPDLCIVLGGPEVSYSPAAKWTALADHILPGEAENSFYRFCRDNLSGNPTRQSPPDEAGLLDLDTLTLPYGEYTDIDLATRLLYVESSRGCAMRCEYCISSNDSSVRFFPLEPLLAEFDRLMQRGARIFKFCDRTFNAHIPHAISILKHFLRRMDEFPDLFLHAEMIPDRFPAELMEVLELFPRQSLQLEIGFQSFHSDVLERIRRPQNLALAKQNLHHLRTRTNAYLHTDLIAGLPGETPDRFADGFNQLAELVPHEIQIGILKKLPGAPIARHDETFRMIYQETPPYTIVSNRDCTADQFTFIDHMAHYWNAIFNSGRFPHATRLLLPNRRQAHADFSSLVSFLLGRHPHAHSIPLPTLVEDLWQYLTTELGHPAVRAAHVLIRDYRHAGARDIPPALAPHITLNPLPEPTRCNRKALRRQLLHWSYRPRILVSACLLGHQTRYDGGHKQHPGILELASVADLISICPEVEAGFPTPRPPMTLQPNNEGVLKLVDQHGNDLTHRMTEWIERTLPALSDDPPDGAILKSKSPSCGLGGNETPTGLFAHALQTALPFVPIYDETNFPRQF